MWREMPMCGVKYMRAQRKLSTSSCSCEIFLKANASFLNPEKKKKRKKKKMKMKKDASCSKPPGLGSQSANTGLLGRTLGEALTAQGWEWSILGSAIPRQKSSDARLSASLPITPITGPPADEETSLALITALTTCSHPSGVIRSHPGSRATRSSCHLSSALAPQMPFN